MAIIRNIPLTSIVAGNNDRKRFSEIELESLAASIREHGLFSPITVREIEAGQYQIIAGERRFRAHQLAGMETIKAFISQADDETAAAIMLAENMARVDLDPIEEANAYQARMDAYGWTIEEIAKFAGVTSLRVQFRLKILSLRPDILHFVKAENFPLGYAQVLADADLDGNRQRMAFARYTENPSPTVAWFRNLVAELKEQQISESQMGMFDTLTLESMVITGSKEKTRIIAIADPQEDKAPIVGSTPVEIVQNQISFWNDAANKWSKLGKVFKEKECRAIVETLTHIWEAIR